MLDPPDLAGKSIVSTLQEEYGIHVGELTFLPLGSDSASWAFRVDATDGTAYFLKVRNGLDHTASLVVPRHLLDGGVPSVVGPLRTATNSLSAKADGFTLIVFPFIAGSMGANVGLSAEGWRTLGVTLKQIHNTRLIPDLERELRVEAFVPSRRVLIPDLEAAIASRASSDPVDAELTRSWQGSAEGDTPAGGSRRHAGPSSCQCIPTARPLPC